jgi:hypothetical protein
MREKVVIPLREPLRSPHGTVNEIVLREPTFDEYLSFGDPYSIAYTDSGTPFGVENVEVIKHYIGVCLVEPKDPALLQQAGAAVAREVKNKLLGFFQDAAPTVPASATSPTTSPSGDSEVTASTTSDS